MMIDSNHVTYYKTNATLLCAGGPRTWAITMLNTQTWIWIFRCMRQLIFHCLARSDEWWSWRCDIPVIFLCGELNIYIYMNNTLLTLLKHLIKQADRKKTHYLDQWENQTQSRREDQEEKLAQQELIICERRTGDICLSIMPCIIPLF